MARIRDSYPDFHSRDNEPGVDQLLDGDTQSGIIFEDCEILAERRDVMLIRIEGEERWVLRFAIVMRESTAREPGDKGCVSILERFAIEMGLV